MSEPSVSVLMGSFNPQNRNVLHDAIDSMVHQSWTDWELLICDDGSAEPFAGYLRDEARRDERIRYFRCEENRGLAHALNNCLKKARGKLIARMDDDDVSAPDRLEKQVRFLQENPQYAWVGCQSWLMDDTGVWGIGARPERPAASDYLKYSPYIHPSVVFRREVLEQIGGYNESFRTLRCEDYELFMRLEVAGFCGYNMREQLLYYREDSKELTKRDLKHCANEMMVRYKGFQSLGILSVRTVPYLLKPLAVGILARMPQLAQKIRLSRSAGDHRIRSDDVMEKQMK